MNTSLVLVYLSGNLLRMICGEPLIEDENKLMLPERHFVCIQKAYGSILYPDKIVPEVLPVFVDYIGGERLCCSNNNCTIRLDNPVELFPHEIQVWAFVPRASSDPVRWVGKDQVNTLILDKRIALAQSRRAMVFRIFVFIPEGVPFLPKEGKRLSFASFASFE
jgi:hypothetical protein